MDGQVGPLPRAVDGEEAQADHAHSIKMAVDVTRRFAGDLGRGIRRDRLADEIVFAKRHSRVDAIDRAGRAEDELPHTAAPRRFQQRVGAAHVGRFVSQRVSKRRADAGARRQMHDGVKLPTRE